MKTNETNMASVILIIFFLFIVANAQTWRPVVLMHGIMATSETMENPKKWIEQDFPGIYMRNMKIGKDTVISSFDQNMHEKVAEFTAKVQSDPFLQKGFNAVCYSQGGLICRAFIEMVNDPPVFNFITWSTPHAGEYGVSHFNYAPIDSLVRHLIETDPYLWRSNFSMLNYWKDPFRFAEYLKYNDFLADINNEKKVKNAKYKANLLALNSMTMEFSSRDEIIIPKESGRFEFYFPDQSKQVVPLNESQTYVEDWIGLRSLDASHRLIVGETDCLHGDYPKDNCKKWYDLFTKDKLNNTLS